MLFTVGGNTAHRKNTNWKEFILSPKSGPLGQSKIPSPGVRADRLCHRSNLFMVSGVSKNRILIPEH
jgi:hypothetical protein